MVLVYWRRQLVRDGHVLNYSLFCWFYVCLFFCSMPKLKLCFSCTTGTQSDTGKPLFCLTLNTESLWTVLVIADENILYSIIHSSYFLFIYYFLSRNSSTFPFPLFNSLTFIKKNLSLMAVLLPHLFIYLSLPLTY